MKKLLFLTILLCLSAVHSCKKDTASADKGNITAEKTEVKTFEVTHIVIHDDLENKYPATFGDESIELTKTSDSTLTFFVPDVAVGTYTLKFELGTVHYKVSETQAADPDKLVSDLSEKIDAQIENLTLPTTGEIEKLNQFKEEVLTLFNSLSDEEKQQAASFYEANKAATQTFVGHTFQNLDGATTMRKQSDCPRTDFKTFYGCTATNLGSAAVELKDASRDILQLLTAAGASAVLSPTTLGISAFGTVLALGAAGYLLLTEALPAVTQFGHAASEFLFANWIFTKSVFAVITEKFTDGVSTVLNLKPAFRSLTAEDKDILPETGFFIEAMGALSGYWNKLSTIFGDFPGFQKTEESTTLSSKDITISNISNPDVQYVNNDGKSVKFKSLSGEEEAFSFDITVEKEGFTESKTVDAAIDAVIDSTEIYEAAVIGQWAVGERGSPPLRDLTIEPGGTGYYYVENKYYYITWYIYKHDGKYFLREKGYWWAVGDAYRIFDISLPQRVYLTYPVSMFFTYIDVGNGPYLDLGYIKK